MNLPVVRDLDGKPWYHGGLRFACTECGQCCTGEPGYVWVDEEEIESIAAYLGLSKELFTKHYLRRVEGKWSLLEDRGTYDCVFLKEKRCTIYSHRPRQCRTFPWWLENIRSPEEWREAARRCEGISDDALLYDKEQIESHLFEEI